MPKFSIIIPLYNKETHIVNTLNSVFNQTFTDFEIVIVNDGSTDGSLKEVQKITDERLILYNRKNKGVSQARNFAMQNATGDYFAFLDADDLWKPQHLHNLNHLIVKYPNCSMYCTNYCFDYGDGYIVTPKFPTLPSHSNWSGIVPDFFKASLHYRIAWTSAVAIPSNSISSVGFFNEAITLGAGEDTEYWSRLALKKPVAFSKKMTAIYNVDAINRISKIDASKRKHMTFEQFYTSEKNNSSLKEFNDMYRLEYAIRHKISGNKRLFEFYKSDIDQNYISIKNKILLNLPRQTLITLWHIKQSVKQLKKFLFIMFK